MLHHMKKKNLCISKRENSSNCFLNLDIQMSNAKHKKRNKRVVPKMRVLQREECLKSFFI